MEQGEIDWLEAPAENQGRLVDPNQVKKRTRDLTMFNLAIDSKLRGCDVVNLKVEDVALHGMTVDRATVRPRKAGYPVRFELSEQTREAVDDYIRCAPRRAGEFLFPGRRHTDRCLTTRQYSGLVSAWIAGQSEPTLPICLGPSRATSRRLQ
jgi:integrase